MKKLLVICLVCSNWANAQLRTMQRFEEFGLGNFYLFANREADAKRILSETLNDNNFKGTFQFNKPDNLYFNYAIVDPNNHEFVYIIHGIRGNKNNVSGYHIFCYYMENRYRYFYDVAENEGRVSVIYDPSILDVSPNGSKKKN